VRLRRRSRRLRHCHRRGATHQRGLQGVLRLADAGLPLRRAGRPLCLQTHEGHICLCP
jgi:hypothetical protein